MQYVLYYSRGQLSDADADVVRIRKTDSVQVLQQSRRALLIEFDGSADTLRCLLGGLTNWAVDVNHTYHLS